MNKSCESEIWNIHNCFVHYVNQKNLINMLELFSEEKILLEFPDSQIKIKGLHDVKRYLEKKMEDLSVQSVHLVNSPYIQVSGEQAATSCMTASFEQNTSVGKTVITHYASRLDVSYIKNEGKWKINKICWYDYAALEPWILQTTETISLSGKMKEAYPEISSERIPLENEDYTGISNCVGKQIYLNIFHEQDFVMLFTPVILGKNGRGEGFWNGVYFSRKEDDSLSVSICLVHGHFEKKQGKWCSTGIETKKILELPVMKETAFALKPAKIMAQNNRKREVPEGQPGNPNPTDYFSVANTAALWTSAIRTCSPLYFFEECLAKNHPELYVNIIERTEGLEGFFKECRMMVHMDRKQAKKPGNHTLTTPWVEVSDDGTTATAAFLDFGWTMMAEAFGNKEAPYPVLPNIGRYIHYLIKEDGKWKVWGFNWGPLYQNGVWSFDPQNTRGWAKTKSKYRWPELLQDYNFQETFDGVDEFLSNSILSVMEFVEKPDERSIE